MTIILLQKLAVSCPKFIQRDSINSWHNGVDLELLFKAVNLALPKITLVLDEIAIKHNKFTKLI
jgi:hypothetical protein